MNLHAYKMQLDDICTDKYGGMTGMQTAMPNTDNLALDFSPYLI